VHTPQFAVETTQWIIAIGSLGSALVALALGLGLRDWVVRPRVRLLLRHAGDPEEISDRVVTKRLVSGETAASSASVWTIAAGRRHGTSPCASSKCIAGIRRAATAPVAARARRAAAPAL
jgi:hypothetical protein